jgi:predicted nucleic acid-binding protein
VSYVVDASVAMKWLLPEPLSDQAARLLDHPAGLSAPDMLLVEAANVLWRKAARREISGGEAAQALALLDGSGLDLRPVRPLAARALELARILEHPVYDCVYLALAERERVPLVTADARFIAAISRRRLRIDVVDLAKL